MRRAGLAIELPVMQTSLRPLDDTDNELAIANFKGAQPVLPVESPALQYRVSARRSVITHPTTRLLINARRAEPTH